MDIELQINNSADRRARYVTWAPSPCKIRLTDTAGLTQAAAVTLSSKSSDTGGRGVFSSSPAGSPAGELTLTLPLNGSSVGFFVAGQFGRPSLADGDTTIQVRSGTGLIGEVPVMVRIRKDATTLSADGQSAIGSLPRLPDSTTEVPAASQIFAICIPPAVPRSARPARISPLAPCLSARPGAGIAEYRS